MQVTNSQLKILYANRLSVRSCRDMTGFKICAARTALESEQRRSSGLTREIELLRSASDSESLMRLATLGNACP
jgi:hypothetical protein